MSQEEWRAIGVQMSDGWIHYMHHTPGLLLQLNSVTSKLVVWPNSWSYNMNLLSCCVNLSKGNRNSNSFIVSQDEHQSLISPKTALLNRLIRPMMTPLVSSEEVRNNYWLQSHSLILAQHSMSEFLLQFIYLSVGWLSVGRTLASVTQQIFWWKNWM